MSVQADHEYTPPLEASITTGFAAVVALLGTLFAGNYLLSGLVQNGGLFALVIGALLVTIVAASTVVTLGLRRLKPWAWYAGVALFGAGAAVALLVFVDKLSTLALGYLGLNLLATGYVYHNRPIYTPGTRARYDAYYNESVLYRFHLFQQMRQSDETPLGVKLVVVVAATATVLAAVQGLRLLWMGNGAAMVLGLLVVVVAALQLYALYGLWMLERWAWFAGLGLFGLATLFAGFRLLFFADTLATVELLVNGLLTLYVYWQKSRYAPNVTVDLTPR